MPTRKIGPSMLEAINLPGSPSVTVWDRVSGSPVKCSFPKTAAWIERTKALLERRVLVSGQVNYFRNGMPRSVTQIRDIEDRTPTPTDLKAEYGCIPDLTGERETVDYIRSIRE